MRMRFHETDKFDAALSTLNIYFYGENTAFHPIYLLFIRLLRALSLFVPHSPHFVAIAANDAQISISLTEKIAWNTKKKKREKKIREWKVENFCLIDCPCRMFAKILT